LKLLIPGTESEFYEKAAKPEDKKEDQDSDASSEANDEETEEEALEKIFTTHIWKRSCLALLVYCNGIYATCVQQFSYSSLFRENVLYLLIGLYISGQAINVALSNFMCESLLVIPINNVNQVIFLVCLLASPTLFDFIVQYLAMLGIQIINRIYISPNRDKALASVIGQLSKGVNILISIMSRVKPEDNAFDQEADDDDPAVMKARTDALASAMAAHTDTVSDEQAEDMIAFLGDMSTDVIGNIITPVYFILCRVFFAESKVLINYNIAEENSFYYVFFYVVILGFQFMIDAMSINVVELYHGWHVLDYFEYCQYRYRTRSVHWKGRGQSYDETVPPHLRSLDQFCFSEQFVFVMCLSCAGMMCWMLGIQIIFVNNWNVFDDPATAVIVFGALAWCRATHIVSLIAADYLNIWKVRDDAAANQLLLEDLFNDGMNDKHSGPPDAPKGSIHENWVEPSPRNYAGLERYCQAFLQENQLWLQLAFAELSDRRILTQHRESLLRSLAILLEELKPEQYAPDKGKGEATGFEFAADPVQHLTIAAGEIQRQDYRGSTTQVLVKMWRQRAQFMLHLSRVSSMIKLDSVQRKESCEICGSRSSLVVTPIYTLTHLASSYRQQRDMSPLWNMVFWKHFYKTFTPTCTTCEECRDYYHSRNQNVPVDEKRFRRLQERDKTPFEYVGESAFQPVPIDDTCTHILHLWLAWVRKIAAGEDPRDFLSEYGIEGRTLTEMRQATLEQANALEEDDDLLPVVEEEKAASVFSSEVDEEDPLAVERHRVHNLTRLRDQEQSDDEGDPFEGETPFSRMQPNITWSTRTLAAAWLSKARDNMAAPQLRQWAQPLPQAMFEQQRGMDRVPHDTALPPPPPPPPGGPGGRGQGQLPVALQGPAIPKAPSGGVAAVTGAMGLPPAPNFMPPPGQPRPGGAGGIAGAIGIAPMPKSVAPMPKSVAPMPKSSTGPGQPDRGGGVR